MSTTIETTKTISVQKNILLAYLLWFFLGYLGVHRFYAGKVVSGGIQLAITALTFILAITVIGLIIAWPLVIIAGIWWFVDAILIMTWGLNSKAEVITTVTTKSD